MTTFTGNLVLNASPSPGLSSDARVANDTNRDHEATSFEIAYKNRMISDSLKDALAQATQENPEAFHLFLESPTSLGYAMSFLQHLPADLPFPEVSLDNFGEIALEWDYDTKRIISIRVGKDGTLNYAYRVGILKNHGLETLNNNVPEPILLGIQRVLGIR